MEVNIRRRFRFEERNILTLFKFDLTTVISEYFDDRLELKLDEILAEPDKYGKNDIFIEGRVDIIFLERLRNVELSWQRANKTATDLVEIIGAKVGYENVKVFRKTFQPYRKVINLIRRITVRGITFKTIGMDSQKYFADLPLYGDQIGNDLTPEGRGRNRSSNIKIKFERVNKR